MRFTVHFTNEAVNDLAWYKRFEQTLILDQIEIQLVHEPLVATRNRKPISTDLATWELRIGTHRVFYDVDQETMTIKVKAIGHKVHNALFIRGQEYLL